MTPMEKIADWLTGGEYSRAVDVAQRTTAILFETRNLAMDRTAERDKAKDALRSIANNTCCEGCQEAARVAKEALE